VLHFPYVVQSCHSSSFADGRDGDGGDEGFGAVNLGLAFGEDADGCQVVFPEVVGEVGEPLV